MKMTGIVGRIANSLPPGWESRKTLDRKGKRHWWGSLLARNSLYISIALLVICTHFYSLQHGSGDVFLSFETVMAIMKDTGGALFLALGMGGIMVLGGVDFSVGRILGLTAWVSAVLLQMPYEEFPPKMFPNLTAPPIILVLLNAVLVGAVIGVLTGLLVSKLRVHPLLVTLYTQFMIFGLTMGFSQCGMSGGSRIIGGVTEEYKSAINGTITIGAAEVPLYVFYAIAAVLIIWYIWNKTTLGKKMYVVGANREAARVSGVSIAKTIILVFVVGGILYGFSGFVDAARIKYRNTPSGMHEAWDFSHVDAITACLLGGVSLSGGVGRVRGIVVGVIILSTITAALVMLGATSEVLYVVKGALLIAAAATSAFRSSSDAKHFPGVSS